MSNIQYPIFQRLSSTLYSSHPTSLPIEKHLAGEHRRRSGDLHPHPGHPDINFILNYMKFLLL